MKRTIVIFLLLICLNAVACTKKTIPVKKYDVVKILAEKKAEKESEKTLKIFSLLLGLIVFFGIKKM